MADEITKITVAGKPVEFPKEKKSVSKEAIKNDPLMSSVFDKLNKADANGNVDNVLDENELSAFEQQIIAAAGEDKVLSETEAKALLSSMGVGGTDINKFFEFVQTVFAAKTETAAEAEEASETEGETPENGEQVAQEKEQSVADKLQKAFGEHRKTSAKIDGSTTGVGRDYDGQITLPKNEKLEPGKFPKQLRMSLPAAYGPNAYMKLTLVDEENGIYETSTKDRNFKVEVAEDGTISIKSVNVEELKSKLDANLAKYKEIEDKTKNPPAKDTNPPVNETPPAKDANPPAKDANPPAKETPPAKDANPPATALLSSELNIRHTQLKKQSVLQEDGTTFVYDDNGYVSSVLDANGNETKDISRNPDGSVREYREYVYDKNRNQTKCILRNADGSVKSYLDYENDENGNQTKWISRNPDGSVGEYREYKYDGNGNETKAIYRNPDGSVKEYWEHEYDEKTGNEKKVRRRTPDGSVNYYYETEYDKNGNEKKVIYRNPDGSVDYYYEIEYDQNGNEVRRIYRNPDGTVKED